VVATPADAATLAEINAAASLSMDSGRVQALTAIAQRPHLSPAVQVQLVHVAYHNLSFDSSKVALLETIIANPAFGDAGRHAVASQIRGLALDSSRQAVLNRLNQGVTTK
jgi:hypothetical protein